MRMIGATAGHKAPALSILAFLALGCSIGAYGQETQDAMGDLESDFFGAGEGLAAPDETDAKIKDGYSEDLLISEPVRIGGDFELKIAAGTGWKKDYRDWSADYLLHDYSEASYVILKSSLFFSARPSAHLRYYGKAKVEYPFSRVAASQADLFAATDTDLATFPGTGIRIPSVSVWELFTDTDIGNRVFIRAGKQMVKWGVGYFFQPADIISLSAVDIYDPTAEREGPVAIKANVPFGKNNLDLYAIAPSGETLDSIGKIGLASRAQFVLGGYELGVGAAYQKRTDWQFIGTVSGSIGDFALFGEGVVRRTSLGAYVESSSEILADRDTWFADATAGLTYVNADAYLTVTGQYFFNGEGYGDAREIADTAVGYLQTGRISLSDIVGNTGMHYVGANLSWSIKKYSKFALGAMWIGNLSDGSGTARPLATISVTDEIQLGLSSTFNYGRDKSQFRGMSALGDFFVMPVAAVEATLCIGTGRF